jgi:hypothetical protein
MCVCVCVCVSRARKSAWRSVERRRKHVSMCVFRVLAVICWLYVELV